MQLLSGLHEYYHPVASDRSLVVTRWSLSGLDGRHTLFHNVRDAVLKHKKQYPALLSPDHWDHSEHVMQKWLAE
jgi:hypothetical protein